MIALELTEPPDDTLHTTVITLGSQLALFASLLVIQWLQLSGWSGYGFLPFLYTCLLMLAVCLQLYYELKAEREKQGAEKEVAIIRVEQLAPFPFDLVCRELRRYPNAEIMWYALCCAAALPL